MWVIRLVVPQGSTTTVKISLGRRVHVKVDGLGVFRKLTSITVTDVHMFLSTPSSLATTTLYGTGQRALSIYKLGFYTKLHIIFLHDLYPSSIPGTRTLIFLRLLMQTDRESLYKLEKNGVKV